MKTIEMKELVAVKVAEMEELLDELLNSNVSDATKRTQKFQRSTAIHNMKVFEAVLGQFDSTYDVKLTMDQEKWFKSMVTLTRERKAAVEIIIREGEDYFKDVMPRYPKKNYEQLMKAAAKAGLKLAGSTFVKA